MKVTIRYVAYFAPLLTAALIGAILAIYFNTPAVVAASIGCVLGILINLLLWRIGHKTLRGGDENMH